MKKSILLLLLFCSNYVLASSFPDHWWSYIPRGQAEHREVLPQDFKKGEVVLSKRTELEVFSNLSTANFYYDGAFYSSVEGLWQMLKYPDPKDKTDPRHKLNYPFTRSEVAMLSMQESKRAGDIANKINAKAGIEFVSYKGKRFKYKDLSAGSQLHYKIIRGAMEAKVLQNENIKELLLKTKGLIFIPDQSIKSNKPPAYKYHHVYMDIRSNL